MVLKENITSDMNMIPFKGNFVSFMKKAFYVICKSANVMLLKDSQSGLQADWLRTGVKKTIKLN